MGKAESRREVWLDCLKGFGILLVVLGHVLSGYLDAAVYPEAWESFYTVRTLIYSFHMPLFFLISGFTFALAYWREGKLSRRSYWNQIFNLFWIYVVFALIQWGVKQAVPELVNETYDLGTLLRMFIEPLGNFWYIYVLLVLYLLAAGTRMAAWQQRWFLVLIALAIWAADAHLDWTHLTLYRIVYHLPFFALGMTICRRRWLLEHPKILGLTAMTLSLAAYFYLIWRIRDWYPNWKFGIALFTSFGLMALFSRWRGVVEKSRLLRLCGKHCLEIYLLHTFFTAGLRTLLPALGVTGPWLSVWLNFCLSTAVCLAIAALAAKVPAMDLLFRPARFWKRLRNRKPEPLPKT